MTGLYGHAVQALTLLLLLSFRVLGAPSQLLERAFGRTIAPNGCLVVRKATTASGEYSTIESALAAVKTSGCIFIYGGTYEEHLSTRTSGLKIYGYTINIADYKSNTVTITNKLGSYDAGSLDASSTLNVRSADFGLYNVNVENSYGTAGQGYYGCSFKSFQDTLYAKSGYQYYSNCYIEGAVDYIFGDAAAWFGECTIASSRGGYVTASSRSFENDTAWYVVDHSTVTAAPGANVKGGVFLGRPWRPLARVIYQYSTLTDVVHPSGYAPMADGATPVFMEFQNTGAGAETSKRLYFTAANTAVSKARLWPDNDGWYDKSY
ncbi:carbohydrate esterase family 8 protein [Boeremia exigua]|uniref:carbohydrate esterase family 8 protein n=1 Tax=Boeremia exigua TaxID=749465 RepID=UPI001E8E8471|nr:carbohydrate esterase family 8 protein [Boeremia exigua]KAH6612998.1 carbohydrate esterase family 8 protein [Boeremia exigua]